jgi:alpha-beta hydrolase superfamily lysophospholipase
VREAGGDVTSKFWEGLYHELHNEPEKAEVFQFMIEWLEEHLS